MPVEV
ncbi:hypothetical protein BSLA_02f0173, partial [Burkholderia stabilis]